MAHVNVKINGFSYHVGCEDGQEEHLRAMAQQVENHIESIKALGNVSGETQLLVLSSLLMADELHDLRSELEAARAAKPPRPRGEERDKKADPELGRKLGKLALRAEQIAEGLERP